MKTFYSWARAVEAAIRSMDRGEVGLLSLDVFDTLLLRTTDPELVIDATSNWLAQTLGLSASEVRDTRLRAWSLQSATAVSKGLDPETPAEAYFATWLRMLVGHRIDEDDVAEATKDILAFEVALEKGCLTVNPAIVLLLKAAKQCAIPVIGVSDMYLESARIAQLLDYHGLLEYLTQVVSSADFGLQKRTGKIFGIGLGENGFYRHTAPSKVLHLGDDFTADGVMPVRSGIRSMHVYDAKAMTSRNKAFYLRRDHNAIVTLSDPADPRTASLKYDGLSSLNAVKLRLRTVRRLILKSPRVEALKSLVK